MRLNKRIAAGILAAAMSMTLLAGCGGGAASSPDAGNHPGNGSASSSTSSGNSSTSTGSSSSTGSASSDTDKENSAVVWQKSKTYQYAKLLKGSKISMDTEWTLTEENSSEEIGYVYEQDGTVAYTEITGDGSTAKVLLKNNEAYVFFDDLNGQDFCVKTTIDDFKQQDLADSMATLKTMMSVILDTPNPVSFSSSVKKVGTGTYDAETFVRTDAGAKMEITCYYTGAKLEQITFVAPKVKASIRVNRLTASPNSSVFNVPSNYTLVSYDKDGNIYDKDGNLLGNING